MAQDLPDFALEPLRILLVEDDARLRESLREVLEEEGHQVDAVPSGSDAIALSARCRFDLMVTDIKTPGTDGLSALAAVKQGDPAIAGIVITGYSTEEYAMRAAKLRVENYLEKPFNIEDFMRTVDELAEKKRESQRRLARELVLQQTLRWFSARLLEQTTRRPSEEVERFLEQAGERAPEAIRDPREQAALGSMLSLLILARHGLALPQALSQAFPPRLAQIIEATASSSSLRRYLETCAQRYSDGQDLDEPAEVDDDVEALDGSLLNMALLLENAGRHEEARAAFLDILAASSDPSVRYPVHFGLARVARHLRRLPELETQADQAVHEGARLGPLTHSQALGERGILLALAHSPRAAQALAQAWDMARSLKDHDTFALISLAREYFLGPASPSGEKSSAGAQRPRLLAHLMQAESFLLATEASGWLLELLLCQPELQAEEHRFLLRLIRACPASFERLVQNSDNVVLLKNALTYLDALGDERRGRLLSELSRVEDQELARRVTRLASQARSRPEQRAPVRIFAFAGLRIFLADAPIVVQRKKPLLLFLYLLYRNVPVAEEKLFDLFWPDQESNARASMRNALSHIRKLICPDGGLDPLVRQANSLSLSAELPVWFDYREFEGLVEQGKKLESSAPKRAADCYRSAVRLYRGPFLENLYEDWVLEVREQVEAQIDACLRWLSLHYLAAQNWVQAYEHAGRGLRRDPLSQEFCLFAMQALLGLQRPHDALSTFEACRSVLAAELDLEPTTDMLRLREMAKLSL